MANIILAIVFGFFAVLFLMLAWASQVFVRDGATPDPAWKLQLGIGIALALIAGFLIFDQVHVGHTRAAIALLPVHLARAKICSEDYQLDEVPRWISKGMCRAFLEHDDGQGGRRAVVTFEGSRPDFAGDWLVDLNQTSLDLDPTLGRLPHGFGSAVFSVLLRIMKELDPARPVDFNGHSMGGANALIAAAAWKVAGRQIGRVTAFEPPRVGKLGRVLAGEEVLITMCGSDPVPGQPFWRGHPVEPVFLQPLVPFAQSPMGCHDIDNVIAAMDAVLRAPARA